MFILVEGTHDGAIFVGAAHSLEEIERQKQLFHDAVIADIQSNRFITDKEAWYAANYGRCLEVFSIRPDQIHQYGKVLEYNDKKEVVCSELTTLQ